MRRRFNPSLMTLGLNIRLNADRLLIFGGRSKLDKFCSIFFTFVWYLLDGDASWTVHAESISLSNSFGTLMELAKSVLILSMSFREKIYASKCSAIRLLLSDESSPKFFYLLHNLSAWKSKSFSLSLSSCRSGVNSAVLGSKVKFLNDYKSSFAFVKWGRF